MKLFRRASWNFSHSGADFKEVGEGRELRFCVDHHMEVHDSRATACALIGYIPVDDRKVCHIQDAIIVLPDGQV